jgi:hypothetical protein
MNKCLKMVPKYIFACNKITRIKLFHFSNKVDLTSIIDDESKNTKLINTTSNNKLIEKFQTENPNYTVNDLILLYEEHKSHLDNKQHTIQKNMLILMIFQKFEILKYSEIENILKLNMEVLSNLLNTFHVDYLSEKLKIENKYTFFALLYFLSMMKVKKIKILHSDKNAINTLQKLLLIFFDKSIKSFDLQERFEALTLLGIFGKMYYPKYLEEMIHEYPSIGFFTFNKYITRIHNFYTHNYNKTKLLTYLGEVYFYMSLEQGLKDQLQVFSKIAYNYKNIPLYLNSHKELVFLLTLISEKLHNDLEKTTLTLVDISYFLEGISYICINNLKETDGISDFIKLPLEKIYSELETMLISSEQKDYFSLFRIIYYISQTDSSKHPNKIILKLLLNKVHNMIIENRFYKCPEYGFGIFKLISKFKEEIEDYEDLCVSLIKNYNSRIKLYIVNENTRNCIELCQILTETNLNVVQGVFKSEIDQIIEKINISSSLSEKLKCFSMACFLNYNLNLNCEEKIDIIFNSLFTSLGSIETNIPAQTNFIELYVKYYQNYIPIQYKSKIIKKIFTFITRENLNMISSSTSLFKTFLYLNNIKLPAEEEVFRKVIQNLTSFIIEQKNFNKNFLLNFKAFSEDMIEINNSSMIAIILTLNVYTQNKKFLKENENVLEYLMLSFYCILKNQHKNKLNKEVLQAFLNIYEEVYRQINKKTKLPFKYLLYINKKMIENDVFSVSLLQEFLVNLEKLENRIKHSEENEKLLEFDKLIKIIGGVDKSNELSNYEQEINFIRDFCKSKSILFKNVNEKKLEETIRDYDLENLGNSLI